MSGKCHTHWFTLMAPRVTDQGYPVKAVLGVRRWPADPAPEPNPVTRPSASVIQILIDWILKLLGRK